MGKVRSLVISIKGWVVVISYLLFDKTTPTETYTNLNTLSLHDALPISGTVIHYFSEIAPCGILGSYLLEEWQLQHVLLETTKEIPNRIRFKHHDIASTVDMDVMYSLLCAIKERRTIYFTNIGTVSDKVHVCLPLRIRVSVQTGRQHLMGWCYQSRSIRSYRIANIREVRLGEARTDWQQYQGYYQQMRQYLWGVSCSKYRLGDNDKSDLETIRFVVVYGVEEYYIRERMMREKRIGTVTECVPWHRNLLSTMVLVR